MNSLPPLSFIYLHLFFLTVTFKYWREAKVPWKLFRWLDCQQLTSNPLQNRGKNKFLSKAHTVNEIYNHCRGSLYVCFRYACAMGLQVSEMRIQSHQPIHFILMKSNKLEMSSGGSFIICSTIYMMLLVHLVLVYSVHPITDSLTSFYCIKRTSEQVCLVLRIF